MATSEPTGLIIVSGGQGNQEREAESHVMRDYLLSRGIPAEAILGEDRSTSTVANFAFSKALLDARIPSG